MKGGKTLEGAERLGVAPGGVVLVGRAMPVSTRAYDRAKCTCTWVADLCEEFAEEGGDRA